MTTPTTPPPATSPCPKCRRPMAAGVKRCVYCGNYRILAAPGTPEYAAEQAVAEADAKRVERQRAIYKAGMVPGQREGAVPFAERLRRQSIPVKVMVMAVLLPLLLLTVPFKAIRIVKDVFRP